MTDSERLDFLEQCGHVDFHYTMKAGWVRFYSGPWQRSDCTYYTGAGGKRLRAEIDRAAAHCRRVIENPSPMPINELR